MSEYKGESSNICKNVPLIPATMYSRFFRLSVTNFSALKNSSNSLLKMYIKYDKATPTIKAPRKVCKYPCKGYDKLYVITIKGSISNITLATMNVGT